jgi:ubiquinone/menaquinone biosynthesis C-methylase UbiE
MVRLLPDGLALVCDALSLPFGDGAFDRVFTGHFYGHLGPTECRRFLAEARRVAGELVVIDSGARDGVAAEQWQKRTLGDGSRRRVYKRYLSAAELTAEIGGEPVLDGHWFVAARAGW